MPIFSIQLSAPRFVEDPPHDAETLKEVFEDLFLHETEDAYLNWNGVRIALNYKYDVSAIIPEIVSMVDMLLEQSHGASVIEWPSSSFRATWRLSWSKGQLTISADWIQITGGIESALRSVARLEVPVDAFVAEWSELVRFLAGRLDRLVLSPQLEGLAEFNKVARAISETRRGVLYRQLVPHDAPSA